MLGIFGKIFGSAKALEEIVEAGKSGIDKLFYTSEERADNAAKERQQARQMVVGWMESTKGQNVARRLIALLVIAVWLLLYLGGLTLNVMTIWVSNVHMSVQISASAEMINGAAFQMNGAVMLIIGFYFAAPHMGSIVEVALKQFSGKKEKK